MISEMKPMPPVPHRPRPRLRPDQLAVMEAWLLEGATPRQIERHAAQLWQMSAKRVGLHLAEIRRHWTRQARRTDYLCHLWKAARQREHFIEQVLRDTRQAEQPAVLLRAYTLVHQMLRERDALMQRLVQHRTRSRRDASPDGRSASQRRRGDVVWSAAEWQQRLANLRYVVALEKHPQS